jgi:hypothetical protein
MHSDSQSDAVDEKRAQAHVDKVSSRDVDTAAQLIAGTQTTTLHPGEALRVRYAKLQLSLITFVRGRLSRISLISCHVQAQDRQTHSPFDVQ